MHCSYTIFWSKFCLHKRKVHLERGWYVKYFLLSEPANFPASDQLGRNFPLSNMVSEKGKAFIKLSSKWKRATRKGHTSVFERFIFLFLVFETGVNRFNIKFCIRYLTHFFKNVGIATRKAAKLENPVKFFLSVLCYL